MLFIFISTAPVDDILYQNDFSITNITVFFLSEVMYFHIKYMLYIHIFVLFVAK